MAQDREVEFLSLTSYIDFLCGAFAAVVLLFVVLLPSGSSSERIADTRSHWGAEAVLMTPVSLEDLVIEVSSGNPSDDLKQLATWSPAGGCYCITHGDLVDSERQDMSVEVRPVLEAGNKLSLSRVEIKVSLDSRSIDQARLLIKLYETRNGRALVINTLLPFGRNDSSAR